MHETGRRCSGHDVIVSMAFDVARFLRIVAVPHIRVSSFDQNPERQLEGIVLDRVFTDTALGKDVQRPELAALRAFVRAGDTIVIHRMDRLARNLNHLRQIV